jgi:predicted metalloendopeptidase
VNHQWLENTSLAPWRSEYSVSDEIEEITDTNLLKIINSVPNAAPSTETPTTPIDTIQTIKYLWNHRTVENEETYLHIELREILSAITREQQARYLGQMCRYRLPSLFMILNEEETQPPFYVRSTIALGRLTLPLEYYLDSSLHTSIVWKAYTHFIRVCATELGSPVLLNILNAELEIAQLLNTSYTTFLKRVKGSKLSSIDSQFEWASFMEGWSVDPTWTTRYWLIDSFERTQRVLHWYATAKLEYITALLSFNLITVMAPYLQKKIVDAYINLFYTALKGVKDIPSESQQLLTVIKNNLSDCLSSLYSKDQALIRSLTDVKNLVNEIRESAINIVTQTSLFRVKTAYAIKEKIKRMRFELGSGKLNKFPKVHFPKDSLIHALLKIQEARSEDLYINIGKPSYSDHREMYACYDANASYFSESNHIVIPWGILQWPFYSKDAPLGWNYGGIGATIGHEMTHAFDLEGSQYNPKAVYKEWWTRKNRNSFKKKTRKVSKVFSKISHYGLHLNGERTLSENWADLGGLTISLNALKHHLQQIKATDKEKIEALRIFFIAYAVSWRTLTRKQQMIYSIQMSVHAPSEDRVDAIVSQFQDFIDVFDIQKSDPLYRSQGERLQFF